MVTVHKSAIRRPLPVKIARDLTQLAGLAPKGVHVIDFFASTRYQMKLDVPGVDGP
jgi:hypothetical protein